MTDHLYAITSGDVTSGGPELMHQLVDAVNAAGGQASMVYFPFNRDFTVPEIYRSYNVPVVRWSEVPRGARVVVPETFSDLLPRLEGYRAYFWWLSVDLYFRALVTGGVRGRLPSGLLPLARRIARWYPVAVTIARITAMRATPGAGAQGHRYHALANVHCHLYQSEYARVFLQQRGWGPAEHLGDYLNRSYLEALGEGLRENLVAYNPAKGIEQTQAILAVLRARVGDRITPVPLTGMTRDQVRQVLGRAKLYIDFGNHPGRDRIPREAAIMGACVLVNRRGSAANDVDVPLPDAYKVDDTRPGFEEEAADKILEIINDFGRHHAVFDEYRRIIAGEPQAFLRDVRRLFLNA